LPTRGGFEEWGGERKKEDLQGFPKRERETKKKRGENS